MDWTRGGLLITEERGTEDSFGDTAQGSGHHLSVITLKDNV